MGLFNKNKEEEIEEEEEEDIYESSRECENCGCETTVEIKKGITVEQYFKDKICEECGCKIIQDTK